MLIGPDGSIHVIADDGSFHDSFRMGAYVNGAVAYQQGEQQVLVISTDDGITAYSIANPNAD